MISDLKFTMDVCSLVHLFLSIPCCNPGMQDDGHKKKSVNCIILCDKIEKDRNHHHHHHQAPPATTTTTTTSHHQYHHHHHHHHHQAAAPPPPAAPTPTTPPTPPTTTTTNHQHQTSILCIYSSSSSSSPSSSSSSPLAGTTVPLLRYAPLTWQRYGGSGTGYITTIIIIIIIIILIIITKLDSTSCIYLSSSSSSSPSSSSSSSSSLILYMPVLHLFDSILTLHNKIYHYIWRIIVTVCLSLEIAGELVKFVNGKIVSNKVITKRQCAPI